MEVRSSAWAWFAAAFLGVLIPSGCDTHTQPLMKSTRSADEAQPPFTPTAASLAEQQMCDNQATKKIHDNEGASQSTIGDGYTSHYDPKVNVCYVRVYSVGRWKGGYTRLETVFDAFEGRVYATYIGPAEDSLAKPQECQIFIPGKDDRLCQSETEYYSLVEKYFGVSK